MVASSGRQQWLIQLEWHGARVSGSITANGRTLLPELRPGAPTEALRYVEWALVDMREGDLVELCVQRESPLRSASYKVASSGVALTWLEETLGARRRDSEEHFELTPTTATLSKPAASEPVEVAPAQPWRR